MPPTTLNSEEPDNSGLVLTTLSLQFYGLGTFILRPLKRTSLTLRLFFSLASLLLFQNSTSQLRLREVRGERSECPCTFQTKYTKVFE